MAHDGVEAVQAAPHAGAERGRGRASYRRCSSRGGRRPDARAWNSPGPAAPASYRAQPGQQDTTQGRVEPIAKHQHVDAGGIAQYYANAVHGTDPISSPDALGFGNPVGLGDTVRFDNPANLGDPADRSNQASRSDSAEGSGPCESIAGRSPGQLQDLDGFLTLTAVPGCGITGSA